jgi:lipoyl(octanoyl) transferase
VKPLRLRDLGRREYGEVLALQRALAEERARGEGEDTLLLVEHDEVVTVGRSAQRATRDREAELALVRAAKVPVFEIERGGAVTWHGPGQLVGYPIVRLDEGERDVHRFLRSLERALAEALREVAGLETDARSEETPTGLWVKGKKIASIGIAVKKWVTLHGFALDVSNDLARFALIRPCDMSADVMTSLAALGVRAEPGSLKSAVHRALARSLDRQPT